MLCRAAGCCGVLQVRGADNRNLAAVCSHKRRMNPPDAHAQLHAADFVGLLLWSSVSLGCNRSLVADVVRCSFELYRK